MFLRQAAGLLRRIRFPSQTIHTTRGSTISASSIPPSMLFPGKMKFSCHYGSGVCTWRKHHRDLALWIILSGQAAIILGINVNPALAEDVSVDLGTGNDTGETNLTGLRRIEDGSVISNSHTSKWRIFTDNGRDLFLQGKPEEAENCFLLALKEAKEGFGERDPHVASACNNLIWTFDQHGICITSLRVLGHETNDHMNKLLCMKAELYRINKEFDKAEPLYLEAINILEESFGPDDIRVGAAFHNLGQFYLVQGKLEEARIYYERALKIKGRVLGHSHTDYADTMYHLGTVLYLQGKDKDAVTLIQDSIRILEEGGQGQSMTCVRRLRYLAQILLKSNRPAKAENVQRKILHIMEITKGWDSLDTVIAAEGLALILQSVGNLVEAQELLERCLDVRKTLLPEDHIQIGANMLQLARVAMLKSNQLRKVNVPEAIAVLDNSKVLLSHSIRIARQVLDRSKQKRSTKQNYGESRETGKDEHAALVILLQSLAALGLIEITHQELQAPLEERTHLTEAETALRQCVSTFKEPGIERSVCNSPQVKAEYLSCLKHLLSLISDSASNGTQHSRRASLQELKDEIKRVEAELSPNRKHRN